MGHSDVDLSKNMGIGVSQVKPSNCFRSLKKLVLPSIFDTSFILYDVKLAVVIQQQFFNERM